VLKILDPARSLGGGGGNRGNLGNLKGIWESTTMGYGKRGKADDPGLQPSSLRSKKRNLFREQGTAWVATRWADIQRGGKSWRLLHPPL